MSESENLNEFQNEKNEEREAISENESVTAPRAASDSTDRPADTADVSREEPVMPPPPQPIPPLTTYRWTYADQMTHDAEKQKKRRAGGILAFVLIMTTAFALSFGLLLGVMMMKGDEFPTIQFAGNSDQYISSNDFADSVAIEQVKHSVVLIEVTTSAGGGSSGTGFVLTSDGYIATNHHVIENATVIRVKFYDGTSAVATLHGSSPSDDLAVIKVDRSNLVRATFAHSSECFVGQTVYAIGNPRGAEMAWTTTKGCISYIDRELDFYNEEGILEKKMKMLQTDAMVNPGNSGGPLVNARGQVVGVVTMKAADGYEGIGFAIPSDGASEILNAIIKDGHANNVDSNVSYQRPVIGFVGVFVEGGQYYVLREDRIELASESYAKEHPDDVISPAVSGFYVISLTEGTDTAGKLEVGDIVTAVNGVEITSRDILASEINKHYAGDEVSITYHRNNLYTTTTIILSGAKE